MQFSKICIISLIMLFTISAASGQEALFYEPINIKNAFAEKTRSREGMPGPAYWQNRADYQMDISFNPKTRLLSGKAVITYFNNSPDTLKEMLFHFVPDVYKKGAVRDFEIDPSDAGEGLKLNSMTIDKKIVDLSQDSEMWYKDQTIATLYLDRPMNYILPDTSVSVEVTWEYKLNANSHMRTGQVDSSSFFIAYFYPRIGVYDDIERWNYSPYQGTTEFYNNFGNFDVLIEVPAQFVVWATGQLQNPSQCLKPKYLERYLAAADTNVVVHIIEKEDIKYRDFTSPDPTVTWQFKASHVPDFAFALSDHYLWDACKVETGAGELQNTMINTAFDQNSKDFYKVVHLSKKLIDYMTNDFPGIAFPYPQVTVFNGLDMMEYPMMVNDISLEHIEETMGLTAHEVFHNYIPFALGVNEQKYAWLDEGLTSYFELIVMRDIVNEYYADIYQFDSYADEIGYERDLPLITTSDLIRSPHYYHNSYSKAVMFFMMLDAEMGRENFAGFLQSFYKNWKDKHPTGYDFLYALSDFTDNQFNWLINIWFFEFGYVDYAIQKVETGDNQSVVTIEQKGRYPSCLTLVAFYNDGESSETFIKASQWKNTKTLELKVKSENLVSLKLHCEIPMDAMPADNEWAPE